MDFSQDSQGSHKGILRNLKGLLHEVIRGSLENFSRDPGGNPQGTHPGGHLKDPLGIPKEYFAVMGMGGLWVVIAMASGCHG